MIHLSKIKTDDTGSYADKKAAAADMEQLKERLQELQETLYASKSHAVLLLFQGMDCSGKDGVIRSVLSGLHPQGITTESFKAPTEEQKLHDIFWHAHSVMPERGIIGAFNRSYYEEVLITRVHKQINDDEAHRRFKQINHFEDMLLDNRVVLIKCFLHISKEFQLQKLEDRLRNPDKHWKFDRNDWFERQSWDDYQEAYEDVLQHCSDHDRKWHIIPSDHRWYRDIAVMKIVVDKLESLRLSYPDVALDLSGTGFEEEFGADGKKQVKNAKSK